MFWTKEIVKIFVALHECKIIVYIKGIFTDSNNIFLWHESEDINGKKAHFQNFSWFQFYAFKLCMIVCFIAPIDYCV